MRIFIGVGGSCCEDDPVAELVPNTQPDSIEFVSGEFLQNRSCAVNDHCRGAECWPGENSLSRAITNRLFATFVTSNRTVRRGRRFPSRRSTAMVASAVKWPGTRDVITPSAASV